MAALTGTLQTWCRRSTVWKQVHGQIFCFPSFRWIVTSENAEHILEDKNLLEEVAIKKIKKTRRSTPLTYHIVDPKVADEVSSVIFKSSNDIKLPFIESAPGRGVLTESLLKRGVPKIVVLEDRKHFVDYLMNHPLVANGSLEIIQGTFMKAIRNLQSQVAIDIDKTLNASAAKDWNHSPRARVLLCLKRYQERSFLKLLSLNLAHRISVFTRVRCEFLIFTSPYDYRVMVSGCDDGMFLQRITVMLQMFFDITLLHQIPGTCFKPTYPVWAPKRNYLRVNESNLVYLIKVVPKAELYTMLETPKLLPDLLFFSMFVASNKGKFLIPTLETWIPGIGVKLIKDGHSILTKFGHLEHSEILHIFKTCSSSEQYPESTLKGAVIEWSQKFGFS